MNVTSNFPCVVHSRSSPDSSYSRVYLTKRNYTGPPLLKNIRKWQSPSSSSQNGTFSSIIMLEENKDVMRPPESSDDETENAGANPNEKPSASSSHPSKRKREPAKATRASKRGKTLQDKPGLDPVTTQAQQPNPGSQTSSMADSWLYSQSQGCGKKRPGFGGRHKTKSIADAPPQGKVKDTKSTIDLTDLKARRNSPPKETINFIGDDSFVQEEEDASEKPQLFTLLPDDNAVGSSASPSATSLQIFDGTPEPDEPGLKRSIPGSPPTSPEVVQLQSSQKVPSQQKSASLTVTCPVCHNDIDRTSLPFVEKSPRLLPLNKQQEFCRRHRSHEAGSVRKERDYPNIDWLVLRIDRIPSQMSHLKQVMWRKTKCYYLDELERNITNAKGNRKVIRNYLTDGVLDIAKAGYYGPRGTQMMMDTITSDLSKELSKMKSDELVRSVGIGGYVTAVLVPELTLRLVMADMNLKDEAAARKVLDESTEVGLLLNPDDDHIDELEIA